MALPDIFRCANRSKEEQKEQSNEEVNLECLFSVTTSATYTQYSSLSPNRLLGPGSMVRRQTMFVLPVVLATESLRRQVSPEISGKGMRLKAIGRRMY
jgi:hypothetical protein